MKQVKARCARCSSQYIAVLDDEAEIRPNAAGEHRAYCPPCKRETLRLMHAEIAKLGSIILSVREPDGSKTTHGVIMLRGSLHMIPLIGTAAPTMLLSEPVHK